MHRPSLILGAGVRITVFIETVDATLVLFPSSVDNLQAQNIPTTALVLTASVLDTTAKNIYEETADATLIFLLSAPTSALLQDTPTITLTLAGAIDDSLVRIYSDTPTVSLTLTGSLVELHALQNESPQSSWLSFTSVDDFLAFVLAEAESRWRWRTGVAVDSDQAVSRWTWQTQVVDDVVFPNPRNPHIVGATAVADVVVHRA